MQKILSLFCILFYLTIFSQSSVHAASTETKNVKQVTTQKKETKQSTKAITKSTKQTKAQQKQTTQKATTKAKKGKSTSDKAKKTKQYAPVNINKASAETIAASLKGIGEKKANAIVAFRKANGSFKSLDEITLVKGIGPQTLENNKDLIKLK